MIEIIAFYEFKDLLSVGPLESLKTRLKGLMKEYALHGTIILAEEGFNGMVCGDPDVVAAFVASAERVLDTALRIKRSFNAVAPFRRVDVKIKPELVTLKRPVDMELGVGTHISPNAWNDVISDPNTFVLDTRNDYEYETGTFRNAMNPKTSKFSDLPDFVAKNLDPHRHKRIAMFCTGGIRCEKFAPYMKQLGFEEVYQLDGGILKYLETVPADESMWQGECFVFDERVSVDHQLSKGESEDHSQRIQKRKNPRYKAAE